MSNAINQCFPAWRRLLLRGKFEFFKEELEALIGRASIKDLIGRVTRQATRDVRPLTRVILSITREMRGDVDICKRGSRHHK